MFALIHQKMVKFVRNAIYTDLHHILIQQKVLFFIDQ